MEALVFDGKIVQIEAISFPVHETLQWIDITGVTPIPEVGWAYNGAVFTEPPPLPQPPPPQPAPLSAEELYDMLEVKGILVAGDRPRKRIRGELPK